MIFKKAMRLLGHTRTLVPFLHVTDFGVLVCPRCPSALYPCNFFFFLYSSFPKFSSWGIG